MPSPDAIILFGHGSRDAQWRGPIEAVAAQIQARHPGLPVRCAYLELCAPDLPSVASEMIASHAQPASASGINDAITVRIVPMFLGMGKHAREDLPELVTALRQRHPQARFEVTPAVGEDPRATALFADLATS